jgi:type I restriction enzyme S subunit
LPDIRALDGQVVTDTLEHTNAEGIANSSARVLPAGTVALSRTASVGFVTVFGRPMATSQDFVNWVCGPDLDPHFLMLLLRSCRAYLHSLSSGAVHKTIYFPAVKAFRVCVPGIDEQKAIVRRATAALELAGRARLAAAAQLEAAEALPASILRSVFNGNS